MSQTGGTGATGGSPTGGAGGSGGTAGEAPCSACAPDQVCFDEACLPCAPSGTLDLAAASGVTLGTVGAACYRIDATSMDGGNCGSFGGRKLIVNDVLVVDCSQSSEIGCHHEGLGPHVAWSDGYLYVEVTAGLSSDAWFGIW